MEVLLKEASPTHPPTFLQVIDVCNTLTKAVTPFYIATTSPKPRLSQSQPTHPPTHLLQVIDVCNTLTKAGTPFCIATTSPKPRVPISVKAAKLEGFFPPDKIHSGESDFDPPR